MTLKICTFERILLRTLIAAAVSYTIWALIAFLHERVCGRVVNIELEENFDEFFPPPLDNERF